LAELILELCGLSDIRCYWFILWAPRPGKGIRRVSIKGS